MTSTPLTASHWQYCCRRFSDSADRADPGKWSAAVTVDHGPLLPLARVS